jgi:hypothetical protein
MMRVGTLGPGDRFRIAHPRQVSYNGLPMDRAIPYRVTKVYAMAPRLVLCTESRKTKHGATYSLDPSVPVILPKEQDPTEEQILDFLKIRSRKRAVAYRVLWDGRTDLHKILSPQAEALMRTIFAMGRHDCSAKEMAWRVRDHYAKFYAGSGKLEPARIFRFYRRSLVDLGLLEEITDDGPMSDIERAANFGEKS